MSWNSEPICTFMSNWLIRLKIFAFELIESPRLMKNWLIKLLLLNWWTACFGILINVSLVVIQVQKEQSPSPGWAMANLSLVDRLTRGAMVTTAVRVWCEPNCQHPDIWWLQHFMILHNNLSQIMLWNVSWNTNIWMCLSNLTTFSRTPRQNVMFALSPHEISQISSVRNWFSSPFCNQ